MQKLFASGTPTSLKRPVVVVPGLPENLTDFRRARSATTQPPDAFRLTPSWMACADRHVNSSCYLPCCGIKPHGSTRRSPSITNRESGQREF